MWEAMLEPTTAHHTQLDSGIVTHKPAILHCVIATVASSGDYIEVYNGHDAEGGAKILKLKALENRSVQFNISHGVRCSDGIYVKASVDTAEWSVFYHNLDAIEQQDS